MADRLPRGAALGIRGALLAAMESGEQWPSPLIVEMARVMDDGAAVWRITTCDTATNELSEQIIP